MKRLMVRTVLIFSMLFILGIVVTGYAGSNETGPMLRFIDKQFDPLTTQEKQSGKLSQPNLTAMPGAGMRTAQSVMDYYIVQFDGPVQQEWKDALTNMGVTFFDYIPEYAFIIKADSLKENSIRSSIHVRWLGPYSSKFRISGRVFDISPEKLEEQNGKVKVRIVAFVGENVANLQRQVESLDGTVQSVSETDWDTIFVAFVPMQKVELLTSIKGIKWVEPVLKARLHNNIGRKIIEAYNIRNRASWANLYGEGQIVAVTDTGIDTGVPSTMHEDFGDGLGGSRVIANILWPGATLEDIDGHGTHVAGTVLGNGARSGSNPSTHDFPDTCYAGVAPKARLYFQSVGDDMQGLPANLHDLFQASYDAGARIHTNSWGLAGVGHYVAESAMVDQFTWTNKNFMILFSSGNSGIDKDHDGVVDLYSLDVPGTAKNCLTVGASESLRATGGYSQQPWGDFGPHSYVDPVASSLTSSNFNGMAALSSRGPTLDGRYKPEIVAPGTNILSTRSSVETKGGWGPFNEYYYYQGGTSMATPMTAGSAVLMREYFIKVENIANPTAVLVKTALIHGADDMSPGQYGTGATQETTITPDFAQGWGRVNLEGTMNVDTNYKIKFNDITASPPANTSYNRTFSFTVADEGAQFRASLGWTDYPGTSAVGGGLVNDLDLRVQKPNGDWVYPDNARNLSALAMVSYYGTAAVLYAGEKIAIRMTPASYPSLLESVAMEFTNASKEAGNISIVIYDWTGSEVGSELYRKQYAYLPTEFTVPVGLTISSGSVVIAVEKSSTSFGVNMENGNPTGRAFVNTGGGWTVANVTPAIVGLFRTQVPATDFDRVNNTVTITIDDPVPGAYAVNVTAHNIPNGPQPYALITSGLIQEIQVTGDASVDLDPAQNSAPTVTVTSRSRQTKTESEIKQNWGISLNGVYGDVVQFKGTITGNYGEGLVSMRYAITGLPAFSANSFCLEKLLGGGNQLSFSYPKLEDYKDGNWWLTSANGSFIAPSERLDPTATYYIVSVIKDNGPYDADSRVNYVEDPQVLGGGGFGGGGGCTIGLGSDWGTTFLILAAALAIIRSRKRAGACR